MVTAAAWALLAAALALLPGPSPVRRRAALLAGRADAVAGSGGTSREKRRRPPAAALALLAAGGVGCAVAFAGPALGVALAVAAGTGAHLGRRSRDARARHGRDRDRLAAVRLVVAELGAGGRPGDALRAAAEVAPRDRDEFVTAAGACDEGRAPRFADDDLASVGHAWQLAALTGAPIAATLERVSHDLASRVTQRQSVQVAAAGAQASALLLAALPVLGVVLGAAMGARPLEVLFTTATGQLLVLAGVVLDCVGVLWTARITARAGAP